MSDGGSFGHGQRWEELSTTQERGAPRSHKVT
jgi:hypothetical protein